MEQEKVSRCTETAIDICGVDRNWRNWTGEKLVEEKKMGKKRKQMKD